MRLAKRATLLAVLGATLSLVIGPAPILAADPRGGQVPPLEPQIPPRGGPAAQAGSDATLLNSRTFNIPFRVHAAGTQPVEVQLYVSRGPQSSWQLFDRQSPSGDEFQFTADGDGTYWFATRTIDAQGRSHPSGPIHPGLKVQVDTAQPTIQLTAEADASGRVEAIIGIQDDHSVNDLQIRYATDTGRQWEAIDPSTVAGDGQLSFTPAGVWDQLSLHVVATDAAGNRAAAEELLKRPRIAESDDPPLASAPAPPAPERAAMAAGYRTGTNTTPPGTPPAATRSPYSTHPVMDRYRGAAPRQASPRIGQLPPPATPEEVTHGFGLNAPAQNAPATPAPSAASENRSAKPRPRTPAEAMRPLEAASSPPAATQDVPQQPSTTQTQRPQREPSSPAQRRSPAAASAAPQRSPAPQSTAPAEQAQRSQRFRRSDAPSNTDSPVTDASSGPERAADGPFALLDRRSVVDRAPIRFSNSNRFSLEYELEAVGIGGVEAVELWGTLDGGESWKRWGSDPDRASPFDIETNGEGVFGFRIVVVGENGLASPRPLAGESPDIFIAVDQNAPEVRIRSARYGEGSRTGSLVIHYECDDDNLQPRPVSLSFSDAPDGPWTTIAAGLDNDGDFVWPADPQLPRQLYLRIDATDRAGNVGTYLLDRPIDTQGLAPRARIRGFRSLSGGRPTPLGEQTAKRPGPTRK